MMTMRSGRWTNAPRGLLMVGLAAASVLVWAAFTINCEDCRWFPDGFTAGTMDAPFAYRVLVPGTVALSGLPVLAGYALIMLLSCSILFIAADKMAGPLAVLPLAAVLPVMYPREFYYAGTVNMVEAALWACALLLLRSGTRHRRLAMLALVIAGTFNRETGVFLVLLYLAITRDWRWSVVLGAAWLLVFAALRLAIEPGRDLYTIPLIWQANTQTEMAVQAIPPNIIMLPMWIAGAVSWRRWHPQTRRAALVLPAYLLAVVLFGVWGEVRLLLPVVVLLAEGIAITLQPLHTPYSSDGTPRQS